MPSESNSKKEPFIYNPKGLKYKPGVHGRKFVYTTRVNEGTPQAEQEAREDKRRQKKLAAAADRYERDKYQKIISEQIARRRAFFYLDY
ncbi:MAG: hypothetical protein JW864_16690 [Spirochaetes bacterium]|nr:hypothetical protein [Spirochaetota bacterium]